MTGLEEKYEAIWRNTHYKSHPQVMLSRGGDVIRT